MDDLLSFLARIRVYYLIVGWGLCIFFLAQFSLKYKKRASLKEKQDLAEIAEEKETSKPKPQTKAEKDDEKKDDLKILFMPNQSTQSTLSNPENWPTPIVAASENELPQYGNSVRKGKRNKAKKAQWDYDESLLKEVALMKQYPDMRQSKTLNLKQQKSGMAWKQKKKKNKTVVARRK